jgi:hypothetical protein
MMHLTIPLRPLIVAVLAEAAAGLLGANAAMFVAACVGLYLAAYVLLVAHPITWRYDALMFAIFVAVAGAAAAVYGGACVAATLTPLAFRGCSYYDAGRMGQIFAWWTLTPVAIAWLFTRLTVWWSGRRR